MAEETKKIVRIMGRDVPGEVNIENALRHIQGVNFMLARAIRIRSGIDPNLRMGDLDDSKVETLSKIIENPGNFGIPAWMLNHRKDLSTGKDLHIVESDLIMTKREDLERMKKIRCYRGIRHMFGLRTRGQRTRSSGRKGTTMGVKRKGTQQAGSGGGGKK